MKIVIAPDSFKGSVSARDICLAVQKGISRVYPLAEVCSVPIADGGEGTMENLVFASQGSLVSLKVRGPLGHELTAAYGVLGDGKTVVIEMAQASGLTLVHPNDRNPLIATSYGTGELIRYALDAGYRQFIVGLGGSATNDAGTGILSALGLNIVDKTGAKIPMGGSALIHADHYDDSGLDVRLKEATFVIASDVTNKLCGPSGASAVFGPQKGASPEDVEQLDRALDHFAEIVYKQKGIDMREMTSGGAAGGAGAGLMAFLNTSLQPGIDVMLDAMNFEQQLRDTDLVITGEGRLDSQTLSGKVISGVSKAAQKYGIPVIAICGSLGLQPEELRQLGLMTAFSIVPGPCTLDEAMAQAPRWVTERTELIMRMFR